MSVRSASVRIGRPMSSGKTPKPVGTVFGGGGEPHGAAKAAYSRAEELAVPVNQ